MASIRPTILQLSRLCISPLSRPRNMPLPQLQPLQQLRCKGSAKKASKGDKKGLAATNYRKKAAANKKVKKARTAFAQHDQRDLIQMPLLDAMRYIRAAEVGQPQVSTKYDLAVKLRTTKNGPVIRNRLRLPHPLRTDLRVAVICDPNSTYAKAAKNAGAALVGEDEIFEAVKSGKIEFDRCLCQSDSQQAMSKSGIARILGPRGLMPSAKLGTIMKDPAAAITNLVGSGEYRERDGVIRMAIGQLGFTPEQIQSNTKTFLDSVKKDIVLLQERISKDIVEIVLSSTRGPGISLNGLMKGPNTQVTGRELSSG